MEQIKKIVIIIVVILILAVALAIIISKIYKPIGNGVKNGTAVPEKTEQNNPIASQESGQAIPDIKSILSGKITKVEINEIVMEDASKNEVKLKIPEKGAQFFQETKLGEGITLKEIGLFDIEAGKSVQVEYNPESSQIIFLKIVME